MADQNNDDKLAGNGPIELDLPDRFTDEPSGELGDQDELPPVIINGQYIKDLSFEAPNTPVVFEKMSERMPEIGVEVDLNASALGENHYELSLKIRAEAKVEDTVAYLVELEYAGIFTINVPQEHLGAVLLIECPLILFPFARRIIADNTSDGGFAPLMLAPIDFAALYQEKLGEQQGLEGEPSGTA